MPEITDPASAKAYLAGLYKLGMKLDLDNITAISAHLGDPHRAYPSIHVAGTNGKGSACQMLARAFEEAGLRVGVYTSPHLVDLNERIVVNGRAIADGDVFALTKRLVPIVREVAQKTGGHPTFFEVITAMAFEYFRAAEVQLAIFEVGLGGRLDSTNIIEPACSCITNIGRDHSDVLGEDPRVVAWEKGGIIKPGVPVVSGVRGDGTEDVIRGLCRERGAPLHEVDLSRITVEDGDENTKGVKEGGEQEEAGREASARFSFDGPSHRFIGMTLPLAGRHQLENAACALTVLDVIDPGAVGLDPEAYDEGLAEWARRGFARARWPARMHRVLAEPLVVVDASHNSTGIGILARQLRAVHGDGAFKVVLGIMEDKERGPMIEPLIPLADSFLTVTVDVERSLTGEALGRSVREKAAKKEGGGGQPSVTAYSSVGCALEDVLGDTGGRYLVTGSIFLAGEFMAGLMERGKASREELGLPEQAEPIIKKTQ